MITHVQLSSTQPIEKEPTDTDKIRSMARGIFVQVSICFANKNETRCGIVIGFNRSQAPEK